MNTQGLNENRKEFKSKLNLKLTTIFHKELHTKESEEALLKKQLKRFGKTEQEQRAAIEKLYRSLIF